MAKPYRLFWEGNQSNCQCNSIPLRQLKFRWMKLMSNILDDVAFLIKDKRFLIIAVNEKFNPIGGCSIDYSLQLVNDISGTINVDLIDRLTVNYRSESEIKSIT